MTAPEWAEARARRLHVEIEDFSTSWHPLDCSECKQIAAALIEAEARGRATRYDGQQPHANWGSCDGLGPDGSCSECWRLARAEGERSGREKGLEEAAEVVEKAWCNGGAIETVCDLSHVVEAIRALRGKP